MRPSRLILVLAVATVAVASPFYVAHAATSEIAKQVERLNKKALEDYDALEFESAKQTLLGAIAKLRENGLDETPVAAKTYVNLGIVYFAGFNDNNRGVQQFVNALKIDPSIQLDPERATPELKQAFEQARSQVGTPVTPPPTPDAGTPPPTETPDAGAPPEDEGEGETQKGLVHNPVDEARRGQRVTIRAHLDPATNATRMFLFYRAGGTEDFVSVPMDKGQDDDWAGDIPPDAVTAKTVQYYLEARDDRGKTLVSSGSAASPYIIAIVGKGEENPLAPDAGTETPTPAASRGWGRVFVSAMIGTGLGVEPGGNQTEVAYQLGPNKQFVPQTVQSAGGVSAPMHIGAELGVNINNNIGVSLLGRFQVVTGANADSTDSTVQLPEGPTAKATGAVAVMGRFRYRFGEGRVHPYLHVDVGYGQIRHALDVSVDTSVQGTTPLVDRGSADDYNNAPANNKPAVTDLRDVCNGHDNSCKDTIAIGPYLLGAGAGLWVDLANWGDGAFGFILDGNAIIATGDQTGFNFDLQLGFGVSMF